MAIRGVLTPIERMDPLRIAPPDVTAGERDRARLKAAEMATDRDDLALLLDMLGLDDRDEITAQLGRRRGGAG